MNGSLHTALTLPYLFQPLNQSGDFLSDIPDDDLKKKLVAKGIPPEEIAYIHEANTEVHLSGSHYCTREHDSLKISNGKWYWFSRGFGGYNALDYLVKVKEVPFLEAVERITGQVAYQPRQFQSKPEKPKVLLLPHASSSTNRVHAYLRSRGIDTSSVARTPTKPLPIRSGDSSRMRQAVILQTKRSQTIAVTLITCSPCGCL